MNLGKLVYLAFIFTSEGCEGSKCRLVEVGPLLLLVLLCQGGLVELEPDRYELLSHPSGVNEASGCVLGDASDSHGLSAERICALCQLFGSEQLSNFLQECGRSPCCVVWQVSLFFSAHFIGS